MFGLLVNHAILLAVFCYLAWEAQAEDDSKPSVKGRTDKGKPGVLLLMDFGEEAPAWKSIDDVVMGGVSSSRFRMKSSVGVFEGNVSLENNGGFASVRSESGAYDLSGTHALLLRVRGDGKRYALRLRTSDKFGAINYEARFSTEEGKWMSISIPFDRFEPVRRGRKIRDADPLDLTSVKTIGFLISEKQVGPFQLEIDWIKTYMAEPKGTG